MFDSMKNVHQPELQTYFWLRPTNEVETIVLQPQPVDWLQQQHFYVCCLLYSRSEK